MTIRTILRVEITSYTVLGLKSPLIFRILQDKACRKLTKRCKNGVKNAPIKNKSKRVDFPFNIITEREMEMEKMLANMKASGTGGTLLSTAEMQDMNRGDEEDDDPNYIRGETIDADGNTRINF